MRPHVDPPPSLHCNDCHGELRLKELIEPVNGTLELDEEVFVCQKCGREQVCIVSHDKYQPHLKTP